MKSEFQRRNVYVETTVASMSVLMPCMPEP
jgi:hypothetical protein